MVFDVFFEVALILSLEKSTRKPLAENYSRAKAASEDESAASSSSSRSTSAALLYPALQRECTGQPELAFATNRYKKKLTITPDEDVQTDAESAKLRGNYL